MVITRTPLRISFVGGGSDLPSFYREEPGAVVSAAIDKYVYVTVSESFSGGVRAAYRQIEDVPTAMDVQHDLIREGLMWYHLRRGVEVHSIADVPGGTGLGSSSAFAVGLLAALRGHADRADVLAADSCSLEIERCGHPIGKQDQYAAVYGGVNLLRFSAEGVEVAAVPCDTDALSAHTLLLYTGQVRTGDAGQQIAGQQQDRDDVRLLAALALEFSITLANGDLERCGAIMAQAWRVKRQFCANARLDALYAQACEFGAWGGKLCGAGGGGFLAFLAPPETHQAIVAATGLRHVPVRLGARGCEVIYAHE